MDLLANGRCLSTHVVVAVLVILSPCGIVRCASRDHGNIVVRWNEVVLSAIRHSTLGPPIVARALAVVHTCIYDAWAAYDDRASGTEFGLRLRRPKPERTSANKEMAISYAAYRAAVDLFPGNKEAFDGFMLRGLNYDPKNDSTDPSTPVGIGNITCAAVLASRHRDGANQLGDMNPSGVPYSDYTHYLAVNPVIEVLIDSTKVKDPFRFQPLYYRDQITRLIFPEPFIAAHWFKVRPFAGPYTNDLSQVAARMPLQHGSAEYETEAMELVEISADLTDEQKMISEYWTDGPNSEFPPGHLVSVRPIYLGKRPSYCR